MPMEFLDRLPVPNLRVYTTLSFAILSCSVYYAVQVVKDPAWRTNHTSVVEGINDVIENGTTYPRSFGMHFKELLAFMAQDPACIWVSI
ncbi:E3 ubiquitin-protein ligase AMFR-like isoform X1 [Vespula squamosa]|uniref:E3 ubiquitin-protein ligase AMFR-like isoform X1 n=1 Tax=Vespula squamosa TaxID=30214 RepID=A0ABD2AFG8_VESSQ